MASLDVAAPVTMIGQAIARPANFINQELYGQPTTLPWGIHIDAAHRIPQYSDMTLYPESTRFHPAFAYEMIWNFITAGTLLWLARRFPEKFKPGAMFSWWLVISGVGRVHQIHYSSWIEKTSALLQQIDPQLIMVSSKIDMETELFSERELEVLTLLKSELNGPEIAQRLFISLNTVRYHTKNIYRKLQASNRLEAIHRAKELGL